MSVGNSAGINFAGLGSGIDTNSIVDRLMQLEAIPVQRAQRQQQRLQGKRELYSALKSKLQLLSGAASNLNTTTAFRPIKAASTDTAVASISLTGNATAGTFDLKTYQLARYQKLGSAAQNNSTTPLNKTGTIVVNDKEVQIEAADTLSIIAGKINAAGGGVTASIINGGEGQAFLTLSSNDSGLKKAISVSDKTGTVLNDLGFLDSSVRQAITNGAASTSMDSGDALLKDNFKVKPTTATNITVNGTSISFDPNTETLNTLAGKINASGSGATANVVSRTENGRTTYRLEVTGAGATPTFGGEADIFLNLGVTKRTRELVAAQDAKFTLDGKAFSNSSNTVTSAIAGVTVTLNKANSTTPESTTLTMTKDTDSIKASLKSFADAYNAVVGFVKDNSQFDKDTFAAGPLFGDALSKQVESSISSMLFADVPGSDKYKNLSSLGFTFGTDGSLSINDATLTTAINDNSEAVGSLMRAVGSTSSSSINFISSSKATASSGTGKYAINVTTLASKGKLTAGTAQSAITTASETLSFNGTPFGSTKTDLVIPIGSSQADIVNLINGDSKLKELVHASIDSGKLVIESTRFGTAGNFTVSSNVAAGTDNSGVGITGSTMADGVDIVGTIDGKVATGRGQFLSGVANTSLEGLTIEYTGVSTGAVGDIQFNKGVASRMFDLMDTFTNGTKSLFNSTDTSLQSQFDDLTTSITGLQKSMSAKEANLRRRFAAMESAISQAQQQSQRMQAMLGAR